MAVAPVDIDSLKVDDIVITSTPQQRKDETKAEDKPDDEPPPADEPPALTDEQVDARIAEIEAKDAKDYTPEDKKFIEDYTEPIAPEETEEEEEEPEAEFDWDALSAEVGVDVSSDEEVVESLKELATYRNLSPALQKAIEIERAEGDVALYFKAMANDPKSLSDREALWEQYVFDNPKRIAGNPKFARMDFDRKLDKEYELLTKYEKLSASEQEDFLTEHKADLDYLKEKRKFEADSARATLQEARDKATFLPPKNGQMSEEKAAEVAKKHEAGYKKALSEFDVVSLKVGDDFEFNVGLTDANKKIASEWMKNPESLLNELGFNKEGIDYDTLAGWAALMADIKYGTFGARLRQAILDNKDIKTLESTLDAPGVGKTGGDKPILQGDDWDAIGDAFEKKRLESRKKR